MIDWDADIKDYFKMKDEEKAEIIITLCRKYYDAIVDNTNTETYKTSLKFLINILIQRHSTAIKNEEYETADILDKMIKIFQNV